MFQQHFFFLLNFFLYNLPKKKKKERTAVVKNTLQHKYLTNSFRVVTREGELQLKCAQQDAILAFFRSAEHLCFSSNSKIVNCFWKSSLR